MKIAAALGNRTPIQVQSRTQKILPQAPESGNANPWSSREVGQEIREAQHLRPSYQSRVKEVRTHRTEELHILPLARARREDGGRRRGQRLQRGLLQQQ